MRFTTLIGEHFRVLIDYTVDSTGEVEDVTVIDPDSNKNLTGLIYGSSVWDEAWRAAERHLNNTPPTSAWLRFNRIENAGRCYDTPYA